MAQLYKNLEELKTKSTIVFSTLFLRDVISLARLGGSPKQIADQASGVSTPSGRSNMNVFRAATESQVAGWNKEAGHASSPTMI